MREKATSRGFTLIEMMITVAVLGILAAISFSQYQDYVTSARVAVMNDGIQSIRLFQEDRKLREGEFVEGTYDPSDPGAADGLSDPGVLDWNPRAAQDVITFVVTCATDATSPECTRTSGYTVTATHDQGGDPVVMTF